MSLSLHWRPLLLATGLLAALGVLAVQQSQPGRGLTALPLYDFVEYWAAGRLNLHGHNPYDAVAIERLQRPYLNPEGGEPEPILMWNPPWTLPLVMPLGLVDIRTARLCWLLVHLLVLVVCSDLLWRLYGGPDELRWLGWLLALAFVPSYFALMAGQISPFLLLGATGFLVAIRARRDYLAGVAAALLGVKPHLAFLFWIALLLWSCPRAREVHRGRRERSERAGRARDRGQRWRVLLAGAVTGLAATAVALAFNPNVLSEYWHTTSTTPPAQYRSPTLGTLLRLAVGEGPFRLQFLALLPGLVWFVPHYLRHRRDWDWGRQMPLLLLVSFLTAPYGAWPFDLVLLLVPVLHAAARLASPTAGRGGRLLGLAGYLAVNGCAAWLVVREAEYLWFIWMTPALLAGYLAVLAALWSGDPAREAGPVQG